MSISNSEQYVKDTIKSNRLMALLQDVKALDSSPLFTSRLENGNHLVFGEGNINADIMFIGEAPGKKEAQSGHPFVGRAGKLLDEMLNSIGLSREEVYITNIVKDRPPKNRVPRADEIKVYKPYLLEEIEIIQPHIIATLGRIPLRVVLKHYNLPHQNLRIGELHGNGIEVKTSKCRKIIFPLYHPAAVFYNRNLLEIIKGDFQRLSKCYKNNLELS